MNFLNAKIAELYIHFIGNRLANDELILSKHPLVLHDDISKTLTHFFVSKLSEERLYNFWHDTDLRFNELYNFASDIFDQARLNGYSKEIAKHLYNKSNHPQIKSGELYVAYMTNCELNGKIMDAVGIFKSEHKDTFLKIYHDNNTSDFKIESQQGIHINKLDKGCLIFNINKENGYVVAVVDNTNKGEDAKYWIDDFLHVRPRKDEYYNTHNVLSLCKNFVTKELPQQFDVQKADQADLLNRSVQFFKEKDSFDMEEFTNGVFAQPEVIDSFNKYKENYEQDRDLEIADSFTISESAVKKQARAFKSVIKLDKNFHIYVHGNRNLIEQGEDEKGKFYKVYYQEES